MKYFATKAWEHLQANGGAGFSLSYSPHAHDKDVATIGHLRAAAIPFYDRLDDLNYTGTPNINIFTGYPWNSNTSDAKAVATIGQLKYVFSFDLSSPTPYDLDGDGIRNEWDGDIDGDGIPNELDNDIDGDGQLNGADADQDGDGTNNGSDETPEGPTPETHHEVTVSWNLSGEGEAGVYDVGDPVVWKTEQSGGGTNKPISLERGKAYYADISTGAGSNGWITITVNGGPWITIDDQQMIFAKTVEAGENENMELNIMPIKVVDKDGLYMNELKVGKMSETGVLTGTYPTAVLDIDKDSDRFFIKVPYGAELGGISVKVSTTDNPDDPSAYNDNATQIDLQSGPYDAVSKSLLLVSDNVDDDHPVDSIADDATGDRTHKVQLGGNFNIEQVKIGTGTWQALGSKTPVPVKKTVDVTVVILRDEAQSAGGVEVISQAAVTAFWKIANERYAQCGVKLNVTHAGVKDPPADVDLSNGLQVLTHALDTTLDTEARTLISSLGTSTTSDDIHVFYANTLKSGPLEIDGIAVADFYFHAFENLFLYNVFMSKSTSSPWGWAPRLTSLDTY